MCRLSFSGPSIFYNTLGLGNLTALLCMLVAAPPAKATHSPVQLSSKVQTLLKTGYKELKRDSKAHKTKGARALLRAQRLAPTDYQTLLGAAIACSVMASLSPTKKKGSVWGHKGWMLTKQIVRKWPKRAEGYYWMSVTVGQYARGAGVWKALTKGLAGKIRRNAKKAMKLNPTLYGGKPQYVLGRYYQSLPWPMRSLRKSVRYYKQFLRQRPAHVGGLRYMADAKYAMRRYRSARSYYMRCAQSKQRTRRMQKHILHCRKRLQK